MVKKSWVYDLEANYEERLLEENGRNEIRIHKEESPKGSYYELGEPKHKGRGIYFVDPTA